MTGIESGKLRHKVALQANRPVQNPATGAILDNWVTISWTWAEIVPSSAREFMAAGAEQSEVRGRMVIRYRENIDHSMRIVYRGMYYAIHGVMPDAESGKEHLTIMTGEGVRLDQ